MYNFMMPSRLAVHYKNALCVVRLYNMGVGCICKLPSTRSSWCDSDIRL